MPDRSVKLGIPGVDQAAARAADAAEPAVAVIRPAVQSAPLVVASPHSGARYDPEFVAASQLDPLSLRRSEDAFVDEIFAAAPDLGAPLLKALFPRAYCDPNREPYELDQEMFEDPLPAHVNTASLRVAGGLGTIARLVASGAEIYHGKLRFADAERRIERLYRPYHAALRQLVDETRRRFGCALLIDCHSMPSVGGPLDCDRGRPRPDMILGDRHGASCKVELADAAESELRSLGYRVARNEPYAGGFTTQHYGRPAAGVHALQIEVNRALYMDEKRIERRPGMARLTADMAGLLAALGRLDSAAFRPAC